MSQQGVKDTVAQMLRILDNIDEIIGDAHESLMKRGFSELHSGVQCDISKNSAAGIFPYQVAGYYGQENEESGSTETLGIGVILSNGDEAVEPVLVGGVFRPREAGARYAAWWTYAAVMEERLAEVAIPHSADMPVLVKGKKGYDRSKAGSWFEQAVYFQIPLTQVNTPDDLDEQFIKPLCELYKLVVP